MHHKRSGEFTRWLRGFTFFGHPLASRVMKQVTKVSEEYLPVFIPNSAKQVLSRATSRAAVGLLILTFLRASGPQADASEALAELESRPDFIRVRLAKNADEVSLQGSDLEFQKQPAEAAIFADHDAKVRHASSPARITRDRVGDKTVWIINQDAQTRMISGPALFITGKNIRLNGEATPERLVLSAGKSGTSGYRNSMNVMASVQIEQYVRGVLPAEMSLQWPIEALKAQAVAIRTYAIYKRLHRYTGSSFDVESSYLDQVFRTRQGRLNDKSTKLQTAMEATSGQVLLTQRGEIGPAYFHADCGGKIESAETIWNDNAKSAGTNLKNSKLVVDEGCALSPRSEWKLTMAKSEIFRRLKMDPHLKDEFKPHDRSIDAVLVNRVSAGNHVLEITVKLNGHHSFLVSGEALRSALGYSRLRSTQFAAQDLKNAVEFGGRGFGHGVGLCQYGARSWATKGWTYDKILAHYYPALHLNQELTPARTFAHATDDGESVDPNHQKL
jgi:stage II sporulation protein D